MKNINKRKRQDFAARLFFNKFFFLFRRTLQDKREHGILHNPIFREYNIRCNVITNFIYFSVHSYTSTHLICSPSAFFLSSDFYATMEHAAFILSSSIPFFLLYSTWQAQSFFSDKCVGYVFLFFHLFFWTLWRLLSVRLWKRWVYQSHVSSLCT